MTTTRRAALVVAHSHPEWLPQTQTWMHTQVRHLPPGRIDAHVVCERTANLDQFGLPNIHARPARSRIVAGWERALWRLRVRRHDPHLVTVGRAIGCNVVHSHFGHVGWMNLASVRRLGARHVTTFYGTDVNRLPVEHPRWRARYRQLFDEVDRVLCEGPYMARCVVDLGCPPEKVRVQHLGVDLADVPFRPRTWHPGEPLRVLVAASFREKKGIPYAIAALARVQAQVDVSLTLIGDAGSEPGSLLEKQRILHALSRSGLEGRTRLLGYQPHHVLWQEAYAHHVFVAPSVTAANGDTEGGAPVTIAEMAATGMPVVSTMHCDIPEVLEPGVSGLLAAERDADGLADHLQWLVKYPERWNELVCAARTRLEREFDARTLGDRLADHYCEVAGS